MTAGGGATALPHEALQRATFRFEYLHPTDRFLQLSGIGWEQVRSDAYRHGGTVPGQNARAVLQLTLSGEGRIRSRGRVLAVPPQHGLICVMPGEHEYYFDPSAGHWEFLYVAIRGDDALSHWLRLEERWGNVIDFAGHPALLAEVSRLYADLYRRTPLNEYEISARLYAVVLQIYQCCEQKGRPAEPMPEPLRQAQSFIHRQYARPIALAELAAIAGYSVEHFSRAFRAYFGMTPMQYVRKIRVEKAAHLLANSSKTLEVVTEETGFGNKSHLVKVFKRLVGMTPGQYREENKHSFGKPSLQIEP